MKESTYQKIMGLVRKYYLDTPHSETQALLKLIELLCAEIDALKEEQGKE